MKRWKIGFRVKMTDLENTHTSNEQPSLPSDREMEKLAGKEEEPIQGQHDQREMGGNDNNSESYWINKT